MDIYQISYRTDILLEAHKLISMKYTVKYVERVLQMDWQTHRHCQLF